MKKKKYVIERRLVLQIHSKVKDEITDKNYNKDDKMITDETDKDKNKDKYDDDCS